MSNFKIKAQLCAVVFLCILVSNGCRKESPAASNAGPPQAGAVEAKFNPHTNYSVVNLVSDVMLPEYVASHTDANLVNAWGMAFGPTGGIWISANETGFSLIYDKEGNTLIPRVAIPFKDVANGGKPTGQVFNSNITAFMIPMLPAPASARFIFATENGTLAAWAFGTGAMTVADRSLLHAVYKGLALANNGGAPYLYATDFHNARIDVFDRHFQYVSTMAFVDPNMPSGFAPFNIRNIGGKLYVTYAKQLGPDNEDDMAAPGNGYVDIFNTDGSFVKRFASQGQLNSPWGITRFKGNNAFANADASQGDEDGNEDLDDNTAILIGNFGDGHINAYDRSGNFFGQMMSNGQPVKIEGLWAISYPPQHNPAYKDVRNNLFFTAGPDDEAHGLFGYLTKSEIQATQ